MPEEHSAPQARVEEMRAQVLRLLPQNHPRTADTAVSQHQGDLHVAVLLLLLCLGWWRAVMQHGTARALQDPPLGSYFILQGQTGRHRIRRKRGGTSSRCLFFQGMHVLAPRERAVIYPAANNAAITVNQNIMANHKMPPREWGGQVMSSPYSNALAARSLIFFLFWLPRLLVSVFTQGCCWSSRQITKYPRNPGPTPCPACAALLRHSLPPAFLPILALRLLFFVSTSEACSRSTHDPERPKVSVQ